MENGVREGQRVVKRSKGFGLLEKVIRGQRPRE